MATREWRVTANSKELTVTVPDRESMDKLDQLTGSIDDDFLSFALSTQKGVLLQFEQDNFNNLPDRFQMAISTVKVRELAHWLLEATADLI